MRPSTLTLIRRCVTQWQPKTTRDPFEGLEGKKVALIAFSFCSNDKNNPDRRPGGTDYITARIAIEYFLEGRSRGVEVRLFAQREVAEAIQLHHHPDFVVEVIAEEEGNDRISTFDIAKEAWQRAHKQNIECAIVFGQYWHVLRCLWNCEIVGFDAWLPRRFSMWWAPESTQKQVWNFRRYVWWEIGSRVKLVFDSFRA